MLWTLAIRPLWVKKARSLFLLLGYGLGVGVMIVLLSVGEAMLEQSRDVSLVGGGDVTALPQGIDIEAMRTGGLSGMFFGIDRARFVSRQLLGGPRYARIVTAVAPAIENKLLYLRHRDRIVAVRGIGEIPSRARAVRAAATLLDGAWEDLPADSAYLTPSLQQLYDEIDRFHIPPVVDPSWREWHYFNLAVGEEEWWYITYSIGELSTPGNGGGELLVTHRRPDGEYERFSAVSRSHSVTYDTATADIALGGNTVRQRNGTYYLLGKASGERGTLALNLEVTPLSNRYLPAATLREGEFASGYVVPGLAASATGRLCVAGRCTLVRAAPAYHDHNWGVWRDVTWDWGTGQGERFNLLYGGIHAPDSVDTSGAPAFFVALVDSLGVKQILRSRDIRYTGSLRAKGASQMMAPSALQFVAGRARDTVTVVANIHDALATRMDAGNRSVAASRPYFVQMRGRFRLEGRIAGVAVTDSGMGFFETYVKR